MVVAPLLALALASAPAPDSTKRPVRIVRRFEEVVVRAPLHDLRSTETVHLITGEALRRLPIDRLADAIALKAGVVARGEELHVRGGRTGELRMVLDGVEINEPLRGRPMEVPLLAVRAADLVSGGLDAEHGGALAGVLDLHTVDPGERWSGALDWETTGALATRYDRVAARLAGPLWPGGFGVAASAEALLDDGWHRSGRTLGREQLLGGSFGWRADSRVLGFLKIAPPGSTPPVSLQTLVSRSVEQPYDPMWSFDGYINFCPDDTCYADTSISATPAPGYRRYRAADHETMTDERRIATVLALSSGSGPWRVRGALGWTHDRSVTSLGGSDDFSYIARGHELVWGSAEGGALDPFHVYWGDEPYFKKSTSDALTGRADVEAVPTRGRSARAGLGATYQGVSLWELDDTVALPVGLDSLRAYRAFAPGGFAYAQGRWEYQGLVMNGGLRLQYFTAGPQAKRQRDAGSTHGFWSLSPRLGVVFPVTVRDVVSVAYIRIDQDPARDFLYDNRRVIFHRHPLGNPELGPSTVISYQAALKHLITDGLSLQLALFYRDLFGQIGARNDPLYQGNVRLRFSDADEGHALGFEVSAISVRSERASAELHYTFMNAWGNQSREEGVPFGAVLRDRAFSIGDHPLDWDRRHGFAFSGEWRPRRVAIAWSTVASSGLPWTPRERRVFETDLGRLNSRRLGWSEQTSLSLRWTPPHLDDAYIGLEVRNLFDWRGDVASTLDGFPNPAINTLFDDYSAYRTETGRGGGAYWDDANGDGLPGWVAVHDPRLSVPPRSARLRLGVSW